MCPYIKYMKTESEGLPYRTMKLREYASRQKHGPLPTAGAVPVNL